ncbi:DUF4465 domain-containing protein [uncultured Bacteroides sp.]|uniref:DUF4465 domain-containing protein n=1 Tax=uncultured Bacteroides sp. TaxID=162156 RepID=UPI002AAB78A2|nr:DUF4465 domain-containing protein [uncultured Bacteroides sp.]
MKKIYSLLLLTVVILCSCDNNDDNSPIIDSTTVVLNLQGKLDKPESEFTGVFKNEPVGTYSYKNTFVDQTGYFVFDNYTASSLSFGGGFTYTNKTDTTTLNYTNNSAIIGTGKNSATYMTVNPSAYATDNFHFAGNASHIIKGMYVTNSTYAYLAMKNGFNGAKKFVAGNWFKLTATGLDEKGNTTGTAEIYLADYRDGKNIMLNKWTWFDLSALGKVAEVKFSMSSTDNDPVWGMNTPAYFCMDGITIEL